MSENAIGQIRQGDVLLVPVDNEPTKNSKVVNEVVLAEGEITGHAHRLKSPVIKQWVEDDQTYIQVQGDELGMLSHEDHDVTPVPVVEPGQTYHVVIQNQWDVSGQWRQVRD